MCEDHAALVGVLLVLSIHILLDHAARHPMSDHHAIHILLQSFRSQVLHVLHLVSAKRQREKLFRCILLQVVVNHLDSHVLHLVLHLLVSCHVVDVDVLQVHQDVEKHVELHVIGCTNLHVLLQTFFSVHQSPQWLCQLSTAVLHHPLDDRKQCLVHLLIHQTSYRAQLSPNLP